MLQYEFGLTSCFHDDFTHAIVRFFLGYVGQSSRILLQNISFIKSIVNLEAVNSFLVTLKQCSKKTLDFDSIWQDSSSIYVQLHHTSTLCSCYSGTYKFD